MQFKYLTDTKTKEKVEIQGYSLSASKVKSIREKAFRAAKRLKKP